MENPIKMDDLGVPLFSETSTSSNCQISINFHCHDWCSRTCTFAGKTDKNCYNVSFTPTFALPPNTNWFLRGRPCLTWPFASLACSTKLSGEQQQQTIICFPTTFDKKLQHEHGADFCWSTVRGVCLLLVWCLKVTISLSIKRSC